VPERPDELYVGYGDAMPPGIARAVRRGVLAIAALAVAVPLVVVLSQGPLPRAAFEFGTIRTFRGTLHETPVPLLVVEPPETGEVGDAAAAASSFLLVAPGKHGARDDVRGRDGERVELRGTLAYRDGRTLIELEPGSIVAAGGPRAGAPPVEDLGEVRLRGEIVDAKCHLGVMRPGDGKTHRDCAARCISGGIPPALHVATASGETQLFLLVGEDGGAIGHALLAFVAEPVEVRGRAERRGDLLVLYAAPSAIRRLGEES